MRTSAHEVPNEVTVLAFLKPEGKTLTFLVRAPMVMRGSGTIEHVGRPGSHGR